MGKREMKHIPIKWLFLGMLLISIPFGLYLLLWSTPIDSVEHKIIKKADFEVEQVYQFQIQDGLAVVAEAANKNGLIRFYAEIPLINRYIKTEQLDFEYKGERIFFAARSWARMGAYTWDNGECTLGGYGDGWGIGGKILFYFILAEFYWGSLVLIQNDVVKTRKEKAANPVRNY